MRAAVCCLVALWALPALRAEPPTDQQIRDAIEELGALRFAVRERAMRFLWKAGEAAEKPLAEAANSSDPEVVRRARILLERFAYKVEPNTPRDVIDLMQKFRSADGVVSEQSQIIRDMLALGGKSHKYLLRLLDSVEQKQRRLILDQFAYDDWKILSSLIAAGQDALVEQLMDKAIGVQIESIVPHYAAFHAFSGKLDEKIARCRAASKQGLIFDAQLLLALCRMKGDGDGAIEAARKTENSYWIRQSLMEQGRWSELLAGQSHEPRGGMSAVADLGRLAAYQRLSGHEQELPQTFKRIQDYVGAVGPRRDDRAWNAAKVLLINEQPGLAMTLLKHSDAVTHVAEILMLEGKYREAARLAEKAARGESGQRYYARAHWIDLQDRLGDKARAGESLDALVKDMNSSTDAGWLDRLIRLEMRLGRRDDAEKQLLERLDRRDGSSLHSAFATVFPSLGERAQALWDMLAARRPGDKPVEHLKRLRWINDGSYPKASLDELLHVNVPVNRNSNTANFDAVGQVVARCGMADTAQSLLRAASWDKASPQAKLYLADALADAGRWADAARAYRLVFDLDPSAPLPLFLHAQALLKVNPADAQARKLIETAHRMPLGSESVHYYFYLALAQRGYHEDALREVEFGCKLLGGDTRTMGILQHYWAQALAEKGRFLEAAATIERSLLRFMPTNQGYVNAGAYPRYTAGLHVLRACGLLDKGDKAAAFREIERAEALQPALLDLAIRLVPALEQAGEKQQARELFQRVRSRWEQALRDYPDAAGAHNQIAWMCARCRRDLDAAYEHARRAVAFAPDVSSYLDTTAEVLFQQGNRKQAIEFMKKCLSMPNANVSLYRLHLKRIETGDPRTQPLGD